MLDVSVTGRGRLSATATVDPTGITLRIDDESNPEFWAELYLTEGDLDRLRELLWVEVLATVRRPNG